jgi:hypothetical protein
VSTDKAAASQPATAIERLARHLYDRDPADPFARELVGWLAGSARFRAFAEAYRDKIRKKLHGAVDAETLRDVRVELQTARLLLADRRIDVAFEAYGSGKTGPDFTVTFRATRNFNLEVTRLRRLPDAAGMGVALLAKLRQLPPSAPNAVLFAIEGISADALDIAGATRALRSRADAKDEPFFTGRGFGGTRGFYERYLRLGAVFVLCEGVDGDARASLWTNRSARIPMPAEAANACLRCLRPVVHADTTHRGVAMHDL